MLQAVLILFIVMWVVLYYQVRDVFSPWSITLLLWSAVIAGYLYTDHGLYAVTDQFSKAIVCWCVPFCIVCYLTYRLVPSSESPEWGVNYPMFKGLSLLALLVTPYALYRAVQFASQSSNDLMFAIREQAVDSDTGFSLGPVAYIVNLIFALLITSADEREHFNKWILAFCMFLNILFFFLTLSKTFLLTGILSTLYLMYVHQRIKLRTIVIWGLVLGIGGLLFTQVRASADSDSGMAYTFQEILVMYTLSPIVAFCLENPCSSPIWGYETFRPVYHILEGLGLSHVPTFDGKLMFVSVPIPTNVYTMMEPFFNDFGYEGLAAFAAIEAVFVGWVYKKGSTGHTIARGVYAYMVALLAMQYFNDNIILGASNILQFYLCLLLLHYRFVWKPQSNALFT